MSTHLYRTMSQNKRDQTPLGNLESFVIGAKWSTLILRSLVHSRPAVLSAAGYEEPQLKQQALMIQSGKTFGACAVIKCLASFASATILKSDERLAFPDLRRIWTSSWARSGTSGRARCARRRWRPCSWRRTAATCRSAERWTHCSPWQRSIFVQSFVKIVTFS